jgi:beta-glucosidase-like glycosyl hydrolase
MYGQDVIHIKRDPKDQEDVPVMVADFVVHDILRDELGFDNTVYRQIFEIYVKGLNEEYVPDRNFFLSNQNREISGATVDLIFTPYELSLNWAKNNIVVETEEMRMRLHIDHTILSFKARKIKKMIEDLRKKLHAKNTPEDEKRLLEQWKALKKTSIDVHKKLGRIITP